MDKGDIFVVGLTGPTGAGKSTAAEEFRRQGYRIFNCDAIAREVIDGSPSCLKELKEGFGADIFFADGSLNRKRLAAKAFSSQEQTQKLNRITHPWIRREILERIEKIRRQDGGRIVLDAPLLFEIGLGPACHQTIAVLAPKALRLRRIMERDSLTEEQARARIQSQPADEFYRERVCMCWDGQEKPEILRRMVRDITRKGKEDGQYGEAPKTK